MVLKIERLLKRLLDGFSAKIKKRYEPQRTKTEDINIFEILGLRMMKSGTHKIHQDFLKRDGLAPKKCKDY